MVSARNADQQKLVTVMSNQLRGSVQIPEWAKFVKTGMSRERQPEQPDWFYLRSASILRKIYNDGPVGTEKLRSYYGGLHRRGHKPARFAKGGGKLIRTILTQLEAAGYVAKAEKNRGRIITSKGQKFVDNAAKQAK